MLLTIQSGQRSDTTIPDLYNETEFQIVKWYIRFLLADQRAPAVV